MFVPRFLNFILGVQTVTKLVTLRFGKAANEFVGLDLRNTWRALRPAAQIPSEPTNFRLLKSGQERYYCAVILPVP